MRFDGADDTVRFTTRLTTIRTVFWVVSTAEVAGERTRGGACWGTTRGVGVHGGPRVAGDDLGRRLGGAEVRDGPDWVNGRGGAGDLDEAAQALSVVSLVTTGNMSAQKFGAAYGSSPWLGDLAELIVYDRALTPGERKEVEDYLLSKYRPRPSVTARRRSPRRAGCFSGSMAVSI